MTIEDKNTLQAAEFLKLWHTLFFLGVECMLRNLPYMQEQ
jgi:hypothetical protein